MQETVTTCDLCLKNNRESGAIFYNSGSIDDIKATLSSLLSREILHVCDECIKAVEGTIDAKCHDIAQAHRADKIKTE